MVIEAGIELTLKAGGSFIKLDPGGITVSGPLARINTGGAPGKGSGIKIKPPVLPGMADRDKAGSLLEQVLGGLSKSASVEAREYRFNIRLQDVPGDEGFPLAHTPWGIGLGEDDNVLLQGETDADGRVLLDDTQQKQLAKAYSQAPGSLWLSYPGQRIALRVHLERQGWDSERYALGAMDFSSCLSRNTTGNALLDIERGQQDSQCTSDLYTHLQSKE